MSEARGVDAVMLVGFGGPTRREEIRPFLDELLRGRPVPPERYEEAVKHYDLIGGRSPYNDEAALLARALREALRREEIQIPVVVGMRTSAPRIEGVLRELQKSGVRRVFGFVLAAHRCEASWDRYVAAVDAARAQIGEGAPEVVYPELWHLHPGFIRALADRTIDALSAVAPADRRAARILFTAHSVPIAMAGASEYARQTTDSARAIAKLIGRDSWTLGWQSRSGNPRDPWLEPDINNIIRKLGGETVVVVPIGFLCDHVEVLYDLDIDTAGVARAAGVTMVRAATVRDHPEFIAMIAQMTKELVRP